MRDAVIWMNKGHYPTYIGFCPTEKAWAQAMRKLGFKDEPYPSSDAKCTRFNCDDKTAVVVTLNENLDGRCPIALAALLIHEAVHVWQYVMEDIGQSLHPGKEIEAYGIQHISMHLLEAYRSSRLTSSLVEGRALAA